MEGHAADFVEVVRRNYGVAGVVDVSVDYVSLLGTSFPHIQCNLQARNLGYIITRRHVRKLNP